MNGNNSVGGGGAILFLSKEIDYAEYLHYSLATPNTWVLLLPLPTCCLSVCMCFFIGAAWPRQQQEVTTHLMQTKKKIIAKKRMSTVAAAVVQAAATTVRAATKKRVEDERRGRTAMAMESRLPMMS